MTKSVWDIIEENTFKPQPDGTFRTASGMVGKPAEPTEEDED